MQAFEYRTVVTTLETLFSMLLMNFNFNAVHSAHRFLGPLFFFVYVLVIAFIVINMFITILNESLMRVRTLKTLTDTDYQMVAFISKQLRGLIGLDTATTGDTTTTGETQPPETPPPQVRHRHHR